MLLYRVFPYLQSAKPSQPGHPLYVHPDQGTGRWDNADLYRAMYLTQTPSGAIGESFAHLTQWSRLMLPFPTIPGALRSLGVYRLNEEAHPLLDFDDAETLFARALRPTDIVIRNRPRTQQISRGVYSEDRWSGLSWWSMHRPQWKLYVLWDRGQLAVQEIHSLPGHPALADAADLLGKVIAQDLTPPPTSHPGTS